jgi:hypothetical protein
MHIVPTDTPAMIALNNFFLTIKPHINPEKAPANTKAKQVTIMNTFKS